MLLEKYFKYFLLVPTVMFKVIQMIIVENNTKNEQ